MREKTACVALAAGAVMVISGSAFAQAFAGQNFDIAPTAAPFSDNTILSGNVITGAGRVYAGTGPFDIGFTTLWTDTRGAFDVNGPGPIDTQGGMFSDSNDFTGVSSFTGSNSPNEFDSGGQAYEFNDGDGLTTLQFDPVDTSGQPARFVNFALWVAVTSWEDDDLIDVSVDDGGGPVSLFSISGAAIDPFETGDISPTVWNQLSFEIPGGLGPNITLSISVDHNSGSENVWVDTVEFSTIPTPGALALLGVGGLVSMRRRRS